MIGRRAVIAGLALAAPSLARAQAQANPRWTLRHGEAVRQVQFTADGRRLVVIGRRRLTIWRMNDGRREAARDLARGASLLRDDGARVVTTRETETRIFDPLTGRAVRAVPGQVLANSEHLVDPAGINVWPIGRHIAVVDREGTIRVFDTNDGRQTGMAQPDGIGAGGQRRLRSGTVSADGRFLAAVVSVEAESAEAVVFDLAAGRSVYRAPHPAGVHGYTIHVAPGGGHAVACGAFGEFIMIDLPSGRRLTEFAVGDREQLVRPRVMFSADGRAMVASRDGGEVRLWRADAPGESRAIDAHPTWVDVTAFAPNGRRFATLSHHGDVALWSAADGSLISRFPGRETQASALSLSADLIASGHATGIIRLWPMPRAA